MANLMELVKRLYLMVQHTMVGGLKVRLEAMEPKFCLMELSFKENGKNQSSSKVNANSQMARYTTETGSMANPKDMELKPGLMVADTKGNGSKASRLEKVSKHTKMELRGEANGKEVFSSSLETLMKVKTITFWMQPCRLTYQTSLLRQLQINQQTPKKLNQDNQTRSLKKKRWRKT